MSLSLALRKGPSRATSPLGQGQLWIDLKDPMARRSQASIPTHTLTEHRSGTTEDLTCTFRAATTETLIYSHKSTPLKRLKFYTRQSMPLARQTKYMNDGLKQVNGIMKVIYIWHEQNYKSQRGQLKHLKD